MNHSTLTLPLNRNSAKCITYPLNCHCKPIKKECLVVAYMYVSMCVCTIYNEQPLPQAHILTTSNSCIRNYWRKYVMEIRKCSLFLGNVNIRFLSPGFLFFSSFKRRWTGKWGWHFKDISANEKYLRFPCFQHNVNLMPALAF